MANIDIVIRLLKQGDAANQAAKELLNISQAARKGTADAASYVKALETALDGLRQKSASSSLTVGDLRQFRALSTELQNVKAQMSAVQGAASPAAAAIRGVANEANGTGGALRSAAGGIAQFAAGLGVAVGIGAVAQTIRNTITTAFDATIAYERLTMSLQQLSAREILATGSARSMDEALRMAGPRAKELYQWVQKLAIESPFDEAGIAAAFRMQMTFGATTEEAKRLTTALVDYVSATGATSDVMERISLSLGQVRAQGKLTGMEIRELAMAGLPVKQILADAFDTTTERISAMVEQGIVPADKAIKAITESIERDFGGAAKQQLGTWAGLSTSLQDLTKIGLREFFADSFEALKPLAEGMTALAQDNGFREGMRQKGEALGEFVRNVNAAAGFVGTLVGWLDKLSKLTPARFIGEQIVQPVITNQAFKPVMTETQLAAISKIENDIVAKSMQMREAWAAGDTARAASLQREIEQLQQQQAAIAAVGAAAEDAAGVHNTALGNMVSANDVGTASFYRLRDAANEAAGAVGYLNTAQLNMANASDVGTQRYFEVAEALREATAATQVKQWSGVPDWAERKGIIAKTETELAQDRIDKANREAEQARLKGIRTAETAADRALSAIQKRFESLANTITTAIDNAIKKAQGLFPLGGGPGGIQVEPGKNGPFEALYRITDVAAALSGRGPGKDTAKWQAMYPGLDYVKVATEFQQGNLLAPGVFENIDWKLLGQQTLQGQEANKISTYAGQAVAGLMSAGKELTPENIKAAIEELAAKDKEGIVPSLDNINAAITAAGETQHTDFTDTIAVLNSIYGALAAPPVKEETPPNGTEKGGTNKGKTPPEFATGTLYAPGGLSYVHKDELISLPQGSRVYPRATAQRMAQDDGSGAGAFLAGLQAALGLGASNVAEAGRALADMLTGAASTHVMRGMVDAFERGV